MILRSVGRVLRVAIAFQALLWIYACSTTPTDRTEAERAADDEIVARVKVAFLRDLRIYEEHIDVSANRGVVHLSGVISYADDFSETWRVAKSVAGVKKVTSDLQLVDRR